MGTKRIHIIGVPGLPQKSEYYLSRIGKLTILDFQPLNRLELLGQQVEVIRIKIPAQNDGQDRQHTDPDRQQDQQPGPVSGGIRDEFSELASKASKRCVSSQFH